MTGDLGRIILFHRHRWQVKDTTEQPAPWEVLMGGRKPESLTLERAGGYEFYTRPVLVTYVCADCRSEKVERV